VVEAEPIRFTMEFKQRFISKANPFGFELLSYDEKVLNR